jgi:hypothetical protein
MAGAWTTISILDGSGASKTMRVWSENSTTGPYSFGQALDDGSGAGVIPAIKAGSTPPAAGDPALVVGISPNSVNANGANTSANSAPVVGATDEATRAAALDTSFIANGAANTKLTPKFVKIVASSSGVTNILALVSSKQLRVLALKITANGAVNVKWQSHVTPTDLTGLSYFAAAGDGEVLSFNPVGWFQTVAGEALDINLSAAVAVGGHLTYVEV